MTARFSVPVLLRLVAAAALCATCIGCQRGENPTPVHVVPQPQRGATTEAAAGAGADAGTDQSASRPRISIDPSYTVLQVANANLDTDSAQEQVIAAKRMDDIGSSVHLFVADSDPAQGGYYFQSWDTNLTATNGRIFSIGLEDLIGDHSTQIVASGMNEAGKLTLDVFRPLPPSQGKGLMYKAICQLEADEISIDQTDRPDSYSSNQGPGPSFPITVLLRDPDSQNVMDLVRIRYAWSSTEGRYVPGAAEKIPGDKVQAAQLQALFTSSNDQTFEQFIAGSWVQVIPAPGGRGEDTYGPIIDFDPVSRTISLLSGNAQEAYSWQESHRTIYKTIQATGVSEIVPQIRLERRFKITIEAIDTIDVAMSGIVSGDEYNFADPVTYTKVNADVQAKLLDRPDAHVGLSALALSGTFTDATGTTLTFQPPQLTWNDAGGHRRGSYVLFTLGRKIVITVRFASPTRPNGLVSSWRVDMQEKKSGGSTLRTLTLSPVQLTVDGYADASGDTLTLQQTADNKKS